jgi:5-methylcytosine-specific restriction endonuclease McrA
MTRRKRRERVAWIERVPGRKLPRVCSRHRQRIKRALKRRDGRSCWYCGTPFDRKLSDATLDHLVPISQVPTWVQAALVLACGPCNRAKADRLPQELLRPAPGTFGPGLVRLTALDAPAVPVPASAPERAAAV